jgi:hypothetical protein
MMSTSTAPAKLIAYRHIDIFVLLYNLAKSADQNSQARNHGYILNLNNSVERVLVDGADRVIRRFDM